MYFLNIKLVSMHMHTKNVTYCINVYIGGELTSLSSNWYTLTKLEL